MIMLDTTTGQRITQLRAALGNMSQTEFGQTIGIHQGNLSKIEKGTRGLTPAQVEMILHRFNVSPGWWISGSGPIFKAKAIRIPLVAWSDMSGPAVDYISLPLLSDCDKICQYAGPSVDSVQSGDLLGLSLTTTDRLVEGRTLAIDHQQGPFLGVYNSSDSHWLSLTADTYQTPFRLERRLCKGIYVVVGIVRRV